MLVVRLRGCGVGVTGGNERGPSVSEPGGSRLEEETTWF
jgi:hypothetical protein